MLLEVNKGNYKRDNDELRIPIYVELYNKTERGGTILPKFI
jgi:hypothetical protein